MDMDFKGLVDKIKGEVDIQKMLKDFKAKPLLLKLVDKIKDTQVQGIAKGLISALPD